MDVVDEIVRRAREHPGRPAVGDGAEQWSYGRLVRYAEQVASHLRARRAGPGDIVVVHGDSDPRTVAVLLGVWLTGAAYLATGAGVPADRLAHMVRDSGARVAVTPDPAAFRSLDVQVITFGAWERDAPGDPAPGPSGFPRASPGYVVYTSGTTGVPRGATISRGALLWHAGAVGARYELTAHDRVLQAASPAFDVAAEEIWPTLYAGARVEILRGGLGAAGYAELTRIVRDREITVVNLPAGYFSGWSAGLARAGGVPPALRLVVTGSEELPMAAARQWCAAAENPRLVNAYGVSEATITSLTFDVRADALGGDRVAIGAPLPGVRAVIIDDDGTPVPEGAEGDLILGGPGVMLGYRGADPRPARRFRQAPVAGAGDGPWYLTGDRARVEDGLIYFLGRSDDQLKVNGVRVDPGEIAAVLTAHPAVGDARVMTVDGRLVAGLRATRPIGDQEPLLGHLRQALPEAMVPQHLVVLDDFPRTPGGKTDVPALRAAIVARIAGDRTARPADVSAVLQRLWREALSVPDIDGGSDFFALGGDSLRAARISRALHREAGLSCPMKTIFAHPRFDDYVRQVRLLAGDHAPSRS
ncbi:non-ribosomal peptide synthetase [Actinoplanes sp. NPDC048988]|uniref:non-ribosomal peptide synthetase n=1 Tax=Actinoplanes sp. NPDC048988 TaxID=3363901 RepID=UPI003710CC68